MSKRADIQSWLNGDQLRSKRFKDQYPLIGLIIVLIFIYILTGYQSVKQQHRLTDAKKEMIDAKYQYLTINAKLTNSSRLSQIVKALQNHGSSLKENTRPTIKIRD